MHAQLSRDIDTTDCGWCRRRLAVLLHPATNSSYTAKLPGRLLVGRLATSSHGVTLTAPPAARLRLAAAMSFVGALVRAGLARMKKIVATPHTTPPPRADSGDMAQARPPQTSVASQDVVNSSMRPTVSGGGRKNRFLGSHEGLLYIMSLLRADATEIPFREGA